MCTKRNVWLTHHVWVILKKIEVIWLTGHITSNFFSRLCFPPHKKWSFDIKNFFSKCEQIRSFMRTSYHVLKKSLMENFIFFGSIWCNLAYYIMYIDCKWKITTCCVKYWRAWKFTKSEYYIYIYIYIYIYVYIYRLNSDIENIPHILVCNP